MRLKSDKEKAMKKFITLLLTLTLVLSLSTALVSCGDSYKDLPSDQRAIKLDELSSEKMSKATSYTTEIDASIKLKINGIDAVANLDGTEKLSKNNGNPLHEIKLTMELEMAGTTQLSKHYTGYQYGKYYKSEVSSGSKNQIYSELSYEDYNKHLADMNGSGLLYFNAECAGEKSSAERTDGGWTLVFKSFSEESIAEMEANLQLILFDNEIEDMEVTVVLDENLYCKTVILELEFSEESDIEEFACRMNVTEVDTGKTVIDRMSFDDYIELDDIRVLEKIEKELSFIPSDGELRAATVNISKRAVTNGNIAKIKETDEILFGTADGKFKYEVNVDSTPNKYVISYENGEQTVKLYNSSGNLEDSAAKKSDDSTERAYILGILNSVKYDSTLVKKMKVSDEDANTYILDCSVPPALIDTSGYHYSTLTVTVTFDSDGNLVNMNSEVYIKYSSLNTNTYSLTVDCTFGETEGK